MIAGVGLLIGVLIPSILYARRHAMRTACVSNFKQIGAAVQAYHDVYQKYPNDAWQKRV